MTNPNKPDAGTTGRPSKYGAPRCPKTDPRVGDVYVPAYGPFERVVHVGAQGNVTVHALEGARRLGTLTYDPRTWAEGPGAYGRVGEPFPDAGGARVDPWDFLESLDWSTDAYRGVYVRGPTGGTVTARFTVGEAGLRAFADVRRRMAGVRA